MTAPKALATDAALALHNARRDRVRAKHGTLTADQTMDLRFMWTLSWDLLEGTSVVHDSYELVTS